ncbi:hypothetical protein M409DRAFT_50590 [Zasmidium cellare ATCC 36951]|uniref:Piwi domain-containing protein n=1 Tax=Zasmidium cellare ATCC 36951 TaxID=1080233 RepID=A0A6A6D2W0_ZASCE|nr:uncharacterized protein M409DRAFT_50590 [Zasmidium cellare ATCC 36951]KAF2171986.1 hypothetical protein M409DRAFT_50590 [Zasmidium cellare ATCC 36951]
MPPKGKGKKNAPKPCIRCPTRPIADYCNATHKKDLSKCQAQKDNSTNEMWRGFIDAPIDNPSTILPSNAECQAAIDQAVSIDAAARTTVGPDNFADDDAFEEAVTAEIAKQNAEYSTSVPLSKQLLEYAFDQVHRSAHDEAKPKSAGKQKIKPSAQSNEPEASTTKALQELTIQENVPEASATKDSGVSESTQASETDGKLDISSLGITDLPVTLHHCGDLKECMKGYRRDENEPSSLWWAYRDEPDQTTPQIAPLLPTEQSCQKFLAMVEEKNKVWIEEAREKYPADLELQINSVCLDRDRHRHDGRFITRQMLEHAANTCYGPPVDDSLSDGGADGQHRAQDQGNAPTADGDQTASGETTASTGTLPKEIPENSLYSASRPQQSATTATAQSSGTLVTNHFKVTVSGNRSLYEYQVVGLHEKDLNLSSPKKKVLMERLIELSGKLNNNRDSFAFNKEGRIIAWTPLDQNQQVDQSIESIQVPDYNKKQASGQVSRHLRLDILFKRQISLEQFNRYAQGQNPGYQERGTAQAIDMLVSHGVAQNAKSSTGQNQIFQIGDNHFFLASTARDFNKWGMIALQGFSNNLKAGQGNLLLNVNTAFSVFYKHQDVAAYLAHFNTNHMSIPGDKNATNHLVGLRVRIKYNRAKSSDKDKSLDDDKRRTKTITGFSTTSARATKFEDMEKKQQVSVWDFFHANHPAEASRSNPNQICVNTGSTDPGKGCWYLPDQLEVLPGQIYRRTLDTVHRDMTGEMITFASKKPAENRSTIERIGLTALGLGRTQQQPAVLRGSGIAISSNMMSVPFRRIQSPTIQYRSQRITNLSSWTTRNQNFVNTQNKLYKGVIFTYAPTATRPSNMNGVMAAFKRVIPMNGIDLRPQVVRGGVAGTAAFLKGPEGKSADLLVMVLSGPTTREAYASFRSIVDQECGKPSLVLNADTMKDKDQNPYMAGNAMKVNIRIGNENHLVQGGFNALLAGADCDTLVLGADLIHPKQNSVKPMPTIAALVGSVDGRFATFLGSARRQERGKEYIDSTSMTSMATERIAACKNKNGGRAPARILYYRDGTGKTQFQDVHTYEIQAIKTAWENETRDKTLRPLQMTTVMWERKQDGQLPLVDRVITSPENFDFFLQSHDVVTTGTSAKPTHYVVLENGMNLSEHNLQDLTNSFCYNFAHSTNAVSYASPAYFADKLCERASLYLWKYFDNHKEVWDETVEVLQDAIERAWEKGGQGPNGNPWHKNLNDKMFWM